jgi:pimeloyl-ACP methyl ester carboxylesterase
MTKRIGWRRAATLGAVLALVGGCSGGGSSTSGPTSIPTTTAARPSRTVVLDGDPMESCRVASMDAYCGRLTVPENRSDPGGRVIDLAIAVVPAEDQGIAPGAVFLLAGGPGGAATDSWAGAARAFPGIHASWDIVLVDQRGTGGSNQMLLPESPDLEDLSEPEIRELLPGWVDAAFAGLDGDPRFYTSTVAADDLDDVRAALGYEQINLYGGSYGATLAQYYLRQHEQHVRSVVLDGGTLLDVPLWELWARSSQGALESVLARCVASASCHRAYPDLEGDLAAALRDLAEDPVTTEVTDPSGDPIIVDRAALANQLHRLLAVNRSGEIPRLVHLAARGEFAPVAELVQEALAEPDVMQLAMFWSISCSEAWALNRPAETAALAAGTYLEPVVVEQARSVELACSLIEPGIVPVGDGEPARSEVPVLLLNGSEDPQDPPANVADAPTELPNSLVVVAPGQGHTVGHLGCLPEVVSDFIDAGTVIGLDTRCVGSMLPPPFDLP